jgi:hypothetical protein
MMQRGSQSDSRAEPDQAVHSDADSKIYQQPPIRLESLMTQRFRKMWEQGQVIDGISHEDGQQVFQPAARCDSQEFARHTLGPPERAAAVPL